MLELIADDMVGCVQSCCGLLLGGDTGKARDRALEEDGVVLTADK